MKIKYSLLLLLQILVPQMIHSQVEIIHNVYNRNSFSLNGEWHYIIDPYENGYFNYRYQPFDTFDNPGKGAFFTDAKPDNKSDLVEYNFDKSDIINVPGDWNSQDEKLLYYEGTIWYKKSFDYKKQRKTNKIFIYFDAVNYQADVYFNGKKIGIHIGGFTPFNFEITDLIKDKDNFLIVKVDNKRKKEAVPTLNTDWWNYGGITRDVRIIETPQNFIQDYFVQLDKENSKIVKGFVKLKGNEISNNEVEIRIPDLGVKKKFKTDKKGFVEFNFETTNVNYWSPENPTLYNVELKTSEDQVNDLIGFRSIKTEGTSILLNDKKIFLKGISIHEENPIKGGRAYSKEDAELLLGWAKELGCNFVRLAHYPHNENMIRIADKLGILVWEEIPVYWTIDWENKETYQNALNQLSEVISRDKNRAATIIWSVSNETPNSDARFTFLSNLAQTARQLDQTRLISSALEVSNFDNDPNLKTIHDPFAAVVDVLSFNAYVGWYDGLPDKCKKVNWKIDIDKPVIISEFGGGAKYGFHADSLTRWSEEYQEYLYNENIKMFERLPQLTGMTPWILSDFRSPRRVLPGIQNGWNRKGLFDNKGNRKKASYVLQNYYNSKN